MNPAKSFKLVFAFVAFFLCSFIAATDLPDNIQMNAESVISWRNNEYKFYNQQKSWQDAEDICQQWGGHLTSILDEAENSLVEKITDKVCWIGMNNYQTSGFWEWVDDKVSDFSNWLGDIPVPDSGNELCAIFNWQQLLGMWGDVSCNRGYNFICKRPSTTCAWGNDVVGAPKPEVITTFSNNELTIKVKMASKSSNVDDGEIKYALAFSDLNQLDEDSCQIPSNDAIFQNSNWELIQEDCYRIYKLKVSLDEFMNLASPQLSCAAGSDIVRMLAKLRMAYVIESDENIPCVVAKFDADIEVKTILIGDSTASFAFDDSDGGSGGPGDNDTLIIKPIFLSLSNNDYGKLIMDVIITPVNPLARFKDFSFLSHSSGYQFQCSSQETCDNNNQDCSYRVVCVSRTVEDVYSGLLKISCTYIGEDNEERDALVKFNLLYSLVEEPAAIVNVIQTTSMLTDDSYTNEVDVLSPGETAYVLTETTKSIHIDSAKFSYDDVYICCTKNRQPLAAYDPQNGQYGCTVQDDSTMEYWAQLISNGQAVSNDFNVQITDFGSFVNDKLGFSFQPDPLEGSDKLCYIHCQTDLTLEQNNKRTATTTKKGKYEKNSMVAVTYKSCTSSSSKSDCTKSTSCSWNSENDACINKRYSMDSGVATKTLSVAALVACTAAIAFMF